MAADSSPDLQLPAGVLGLGMQSHLQCFALLGHMIRHIPGRTHYFIMDYFLDDVRVHFQVHFDGLASKIRLVTISTASIKQ